MSCLSKDRLKICHFVSGDLWGGAEAQAYSLLAELNLLNSVSVQVILLNHGLLADQLSKAGITINVIDEVKENPMELIINLYRILRRNKPDIIHCHGYKENFLGGIVGKVLNIKVLRTHHGKGMLDASRFYRGVEWLNATYLTDCLISVSKDIRELLVKKGYDPNKITVIHNAIASKFNMDDNSAATLKSFLGIDDHSIVVGTAGRIVPVKGHKYFIEAAKKILNERDNVYFLIVGDGPLKEELINDVNTCGIGKRIIFTGFKSNIMDYISIMDIFVMSSIHEGVPMVILEAMLLRKAVVATAVGGVPEVINDNIDGILVPKNDINRLSSAIIMLIDNNNLRETISTKAQEKVETSFSIHQYVDKMIATYCNMF